MTQCAIAAAGLGAVAFGLAMLWSRSLYVGAVCLLAVLLQTALIYMLLGAPLLGLLQVMIYAGAVMVLAVVTIMASGGGPSGERFADFSLPRPLAALGVLAVAVELALTLASTRASAPTPAAAGLSAAFGANLFHAYALATEAVTLLMFLASLAILPDREPS